MSIPDELEGHGGDSGLFCPPQSMPVPPRALVTRSERLLCSSLLHLINTHLALHPDTTLKDVRNVLRHVRRILT